MQPVEPLHECSHCAHSNDGKFDEWLFLVHLACWCLLLGFIVALKIRHAWSTELTRGLWINPILN